MTTNPAGLYREAADLQGDLWRRCALRRRRRASQFLRLAARRLANLTPSFRRSGDETARVAAAMARLGDALREIKPDSRLDCARRWVADLAFRMILSLILTPIGFLATRSVALVRQLERWRR